MRLWTIHPKYLDPPGLVALWREALLAKAVLSGKTKGYRHHPQLIRLRETKKPLACINSYLAAVYAEAQTRGYHFDRRKIGTVRRINLIPETSGQLQFEWAHLLEKLCRRNPARYRAFKSTVKPESHPLFRIRKGNIRPWERTA